MTERQHLMPSNATALERAVSLTLDRTPELGPGADDLHAFKLRAPINETVLPWLVIEYGLGPITPYLPNLATVIEYGVRWNKVKGTPQGIREALSWIGYTYDTLYEAPTRRTRWHLFELELDRFWDREADLDLAEAVGRLSEPARSPFWRGWREYNVRAFEWSASRWGDAIWSDASGVRLHDGGVQWSFGRTHEPEGGVHVFTEQELTDLGLWIEPVEDGGLSWGPFPWTTGGLKWTSAGAMARARVIATGLLAKSFWIALKRGDGTVVGHRRARAVHCVTAQFGGRYQAGGTQYEPEPDLSDRLYVEAMTAFGEGAGETVASWNLVIGGALPAGAKPGVMWLPGDTLVGGVAVGSFIIPDAVIGQTDRERCRGVFRIE